MSLDGDGDVLHYGLCVCTRCTLPYAKLMPMDSWTFNENERDSFKWLRKYLTGRKREAFRSIYHRFISLKVDLEPAVSFHFVHHFYEEELWFCSNSCKFRGNLHESNNLLLGASGARGGGGWGVWISWCVTWPEDDNLSSISTQPWKRTIKVWPRTEVEPVNDQRRQVRQVFTFSTKSRKAMMVIAS